MTLPTRYQKLAQLAKVRPKGKWIAKIRLEHQEFDVSDSELVQNFADYLTECHDQIDSLLSDLEKALEAKEILMECAEFYQHMYRGPNGKDKSSWYGQKAIEALARMKELEKK